MTATQTTPGESPRGVPHTDDLHEPAAPETGAPVGQGDGHDVGQGQAAAHADPGPAEHERQDDGQDPDADDGDDAERGFPAGQVAVGGASVMTTLGAVLWQTVGVMGVVAGGLLAAGGLALYAGRRLGLIGNGRSGRSATRTSTMRTVGGGRAGGLGSMFGRGRGGGAGRAGGRGAGRGGGLLGGGRSGKSGGRGAALGMPGLGKRARGGGGAGKAGGGSAGRAGGGAGGARKAARRAADRAGRAVLATGAGQRAAKAAKTGAAKVGAAGRAARAAARRADAATGGRAGRALRALGARGRRAAGAAGRRIDAETGGRAGRWMRRHRGTVRAAGRGAGLGALVAAVFFGPGWLAGLIVSALAGLAAWRRKRRQAKEAEEAAQEDGAESAEESKAGGAEGAEAGRAGRRAGPPVRDYRARTTNPRMTRRFALEAGFPLAVSAAEVNTAAAAYEPEDMWVISKDLRQLPDVFANVGLAIRTYAQKLEGDYPISPQVVEQIGQLYVGLGALAQAAQEIEPLFRTLHAEDLKREEAPRTGEHKWNV